MLFELLRLLGDGGVHSVRELARRLGASEEMVAAMAEDLARRGYLAPVEGGCSGACGGCSVVGSCLAAGPAGPVLVLTPQGRRAAAGVH